MEAVKAGGSPHGTKREGDHAAAVLEGLAAKRDGVVPPAARRRCKVVRKMSTKVSVTNRARYIPFWVELLQNGTDEEKEMGAAALWGSSSSAEDGNMISMAGGIPPLVALVQNGNDVHKVNAAGAIWNLSVNSNNHEKIVAAGGVPPLVALVWSGTVEQKKNASAALWNLSVNPENDGIIAASGGIAALVALLGSGNAIQKVNASAALWNLSINPTNQQCIAEAGGIPQLVALVQNGNEVQRENASAALWNLSADTDIQGQIVTAGGIRPLVELVQNGTDVQKVNGSAVLWNLSATSYNREKIATAGSIPPLVSLMQTGTDMQKEKASGALRLLALNYSNHDAIATGGGIFQLVELVRNGNDVQQENASAALWNLSVNAENDGKIATAGGIPPLVALLKNGTDLQKVNASAVLWNLAFGNPDSTANDGLVERLVMLVCEGNSTQCESAAAVLRHLATYFNEDSKVRAAKNGAIHALIAFIENPGQSQWIHEGLTALLGLCIHCGDTMRSIVEKADGQKVLSRTLESDNERNKEPAMELLSWLVCNLSETSHLCKKMCEAESICWHVLERLQSLVDHGVCSLGTVQSRFNALLKSNEGKPRLLRVISAHAFVDAVAELHRQLDLMDSHENIDWWKPRWETEKATMIQHVFDWDVGNLVRELDDTNAQVEALILVAHEIRHNKNTYSEEEQVFLCAARGRLEGYFGLEVSKEETWFIARHDIQINDEFFGRGAFGKRHRGIYVNTDVVVKFVTVESVQQSANFVKEVGLWYEASSHPNIVPLYGASHVSEPCFIVYKYATGGSLPDYLKRDRSNTWRLLLDVTHGLQFLHSKGIIHGDLNDDNISVDEDTAMLNVGMNFTSAGLQTDCNQMETIQWLAPELVLGGRASFEADVYSLGMVLVEAVTGRLPWGMAPDLSVKWHKKNGKFIKQPESMSDEAWELVCAMCDFDPSKRMKLDDVEKRIGYFAATEAKAFVQKKPVKPFPKMEETVSVQVSEAEIDMETGDYTSVFDDGCVRPFGLIPVDLLRTLSSRCVGGYVIFRGVIQRMQQLLGAVNPASTCDEQIFVEVGVVELLERVLASSYLNYDAKMDLDSSPTSSVDGEMISTRVILGLMQTPQRAAFVYSVHKQLDALVNTSWSCYENMLSWQNTWENDRRAQAEYFLALSAQDGLLMPINHVTLGIFQNGLTFMAKQEFALLEEELELMKRVEQWLSRSDAELTNNRLESTPKAVLPILLAQDRVELVVDTTEDTTSRTGFGTWLNVPVRIWWVSQGNGLAAARLWHSLNHPHVLKLLDYCKMSNKYALLTERQHYSSLNDYLRRDESHIPCLWRRLFEVALGLQYLHEAGIVHSDVRCRNVLVDVNGTASIGGLCRSFYANAPHTRIQGRGNEAEVSWRSPEELGEEHTQTLASDVYSFGLTIIEAAVGDVPWTNTTHDIVLDKIKSGSLPSRPPNFSGEQWRLIQRMCAFHPSERSTIQETVRDLSKFAEAEYRAQPHDNIPTGFSLLTTVPCGGELAHVLRCEWVTAPYEAKCFADACGSRYPSNGTESTLVPCAPSADYEGSIVGASEGGGGGDGGGGIETESSLWPLWFIPEYETWTAEFEHCGETEFTSRRLGTWMDAAAVIERENDSSLAGRANVTNVANIWYQLKHPNVLHLFGACHLAEPPFFVCEYTAFGTLNMYLHDGNHGGERWQLLYEVSCGLQYIHSRGIVHDDLKCDNVLIAQDRKAKISQFYLSKNVTEDVVLTTARRGRSPRWTAPELFKKGNQPSFASDTYALGMCVIEATTGEMPWGSRFSDLLVKSRVMNGVLPPKPPILTLHQWEFVQRMCSKDPESRPSVQNVTHQLRCFAAIENEVIKKHNICRSDENCQLAQEAVFERFRDIYDGEMEDGDVDSLSSHGSDDNSTSQTSKFESIIEQAANEVLLSKWSARLQSCRQETDECSTAFMLGNERVASRNDQCVPCWRIDPRHLEWGDQIGAGGFGKVFRGTWLNAPVAIKKVNNETDADNEMFHRELDIWYSLNHPNIVNLFGAGDNFFVCDLANKSKGDLARPGMACGKKDVWKLLYQTASALQYLHSRGIVHGDLKGNNVLVNGNGQAQLTDFGFSFLLTLMKETARVPSTAAVRWKAPESFPNTKTAPADAPGSSNHAATFMSDIYAFGMCIVEAISGELPWGIVPDPAVAYHVRRGRIPRQPSCFTDTVWEMVRRMCRLEKEQRLPLALVVRLLGIFAFDKVAYISDRLFVSKMVSEWTQSKLAGRSQDTPVEAPSHTGEGVLAA